MTNLALRPIVQSSADLVMPIRNPSSLPSSLRPGLWLATVCAVLLVLAQAVMPLAHLAWGHEHDGSHRATHAAWTGADIPAWHDADHERDDACPVCHVIQAGGTAIEPAPPALPTAAMARPRDILARPFSRRLSKPDVLATSPRGPPMMAGDRPSSRMG